MAETVTIDRPRPRKPATVSASALALHLDCTRTYIGKLEAEGVIQRQGDGFPLDQSRVAYLRYLRRERRRSPPSIPRPNHALNTGGSVCLRLAIGLVPVRLGGSFARRFARRPQEVGNIGIRNCEARRINRDERRILEPPQKEYFFEGCWTRHNWKAE